MQLKIDKISLSWFRNVYDTAVAGYVSLLEIYNNIKSCKFAGIDKLQRPQITPHVRLYSSRKLDDGYDYTNVIHADIDTFKKNQDYEGLKQLKAKLLKDDRVLMMFESPSHLGLKVFFYYDDFDTFDLAKRKMLQLFKSQYSIDLDEQPLKLNSLCTLGDDKDVYFNPDAFSISSIELKYNISKRIYSNDTYEFDINEIEDVIKMVILKIEGKYGAFREGNRNNFIFHFAYESARAGIPIDYVINYFPSSPDFTDTEIKNTIKNGYKFVNQHNEFAKYSLYYKKLLNENNKTYDIPQSSSTTNNNTIENKKIEVKDIIKGILDSEKVYTLVKKDGLREDYIDLYKKEGVILQNISLDNIITQVNNNAYNVYDKAIPKIKDVKYIQGLANKLYMDDVLQNTIDKVVYPLDKTNCITITKDDIILSKEDDYNIISASILPHKISRMVINMLEQKSDKTEIADIINNSVYYKFIAAAVFDNKYTEEQMLALMDIIGYLTSGICLSDNKRAVIFTDRESVEANAGGSGKSLLANSFKYFLPIGTVDGRTFDPLNRFKFQNLSGTEKIIILEDVGKRFNLSMLYPSITEKLTIEQKNVRSLQIPSEFGYKFLITANALELSNDASDLRRRLIIEFSNHYNKNYTPRDEFGIDLFTQFDEKQWAYYYHFLITCIFIFLNSKLKTAQEVFSDRLSDDKIAYKYYDYEEYLGEYLPIDNEANISISFFYDKFKALSGSRISLKTFRKNFINWLNFKGWSVVDENVRIYENGERKRAIKIRKTKL
jgi:hypothetical protein